jgi:hypothetical protein
MKVNTSKIKNTKIKNNIKKYLHPKDKECKQKDKLEATEIHIVSKILFLRKKNGMEWIVQEKKTKITSHFVLQNRGARFPPIKI